MNSLIFLYLKRLLAYVFSRKVSKGCTPNYLCHSFLQIMIVCWFSLFVLSLYFQINLIVRKLKFSLLKQLSHLDLLLLHHLSQYLLFLSLKFLQDPPLHLCLLPPLLQLCILLGFHLVIFRVLICSTNNFLLQSHQTHLHYHHSSFSFSKFFCLFS